MTPPKFEEPPGEAGSANPRESNNTCPLSGLIFLVSVLFMLREASNQAGSCKRIVASRRSKRKPACGRCAHVFRRVAQDVAAGRNTSDSQCTMICDTGFLFPLSFSNTRTHVVLAAVRNQQYISGCTLWPCGRPSSKTSCRCACHNNNICDDSLLFSSALVENVFRSRLGSAAIFRILLHGIYQAMTRTQHMLMYGSIFHCASTSHAAPSARLLT